MRTFILILILIQLFACGRTYKLTESDKELIPYGGNEILVFKSSLNDRDTIFLTGFKEWTGHTDPLNPFGTQHKGIGLLTTRTDPNYDRYLEEKSLVALSPTKRGVFITFDIAMKRSWFYDLNSYSLEQLDSIPNSDLTIGTRTYLDVKTFNATEYAKQFSERDNYADRFYWSLTEGFLGLDRSGERWRLIEKYVP